MSGSTQTLFLPGAGGSAAFWRPVAELARLQGVFLAWPGLGAEPAKPGVRGIDDLVEQVLGQMQGRPVDLVAQSMGGVVALKVALAAPGLVRRLVLAVTSGGVPVADLGGADWRPEYFAAFPQAASWIAEPVEDMSEKIRTLQVPTLLLWGGRDEISPVAVGERLRDLLPDARLCVMPEAGHDLAQTHAPWVAHEVAGFLGSMRNRGAECAAR